MADSEINGSAPLGSNERKMYEQEYKQSADLFKQALDQYSKSDDPFQKDEFQDVMNKSLQVLNEAARGLMRKELLKQNEKIAADYARFQKYPDDQLAQKKLSQDLDQAKKSIGY